jgi:hypothetical protein
MLQILVISSIFTLLTARGRRGGPPAAAPPPFSPATAAAVVASSKTEVRSLSFTNDARFRALAPEEGGGRRERGGLMRLLKDTCGKIAHSDTIILWLGLRLE